MNHRNICLLICLMTPFLFFACAPAYVPNVINAPLLSNKGEVQVAINTGISGFDPQAAYAITDHLGVMANGSFANRTNDSTNNYHKHQFGEIGIGYYTPFENNGRFEIYGGGGYGKLKALSDWDYWQSRTNVECIRLFLQPSIGAVSNVFDASFSPRLVYVRLNEGVIGTSGVFIEPVVTGKLGYKYVKAVMQLGLSVPLTSDQINFDYQPFIFSIGIRGYIGKKHDEKKL